MSIASASASPNRPSRSPDRAVPRPERDLGLADVERIEHHQAAIEQRLHLRSLVWDRPVRLRLRRGTGGAPGAAVSSNAAKTANDSS